MRVLIVESDSNLAAFLKKGLENEGHSAECLRDGETVLQYAVDQQPDLIVLDLGVSETDEFEVLPALQAQGSDAALLVLTGRNDLHARIQCLDMGADDCLLKPFSFLEFTARCRALLRRRTQATGQVLRCGDLELNRVNHQVRCGDREVSLTTKEFALLEYLMLRRGESVSRAELLANVWKLEAETGTNIVDVYINYLRRKLEGAAGSGYGKLIETVRGTGYRVGGPSRGATRLGDSTVGAMPQDRSLVLRRPLNRAAPSVQVIPEVAVNPC